MVKRLFWLLLIVPNMAVIANTLETEEDKMSYSLGLYDGRRLVRDDFGFALNLEIYIQGMEDGILQKSLKLNDEQINKAFNAYLAIKKTKQDQKNKANVVNKNKIKQSPQEQDSR